MTSKPGRLRLFCFPYAGSGASVYRSWPAALAPEIEVVPVQLPGREERMLQAPYSRLTPLIGWLAEQLGPRLDVPYALFGHSMGALISFELARHLRAHGRGPLHLFVSGRRAPQLPVSDRTISHLPAAAFAQALQQLGGTPDEVLANAELMQLLLPTMRADFTLCETYLYQPGEPLDCSISAFGGEQDPSVSRAALAAWRTQTGAEFRLRMLQGDHFFLRGAQAQLLAAIVEDLSRRSGETSSGASPGGERDVTATGI